MKHRRIKVLVADDHPIVRRGVKQIIEESSDMVVSGEASSGSEVLDRVAESDYDVLLLDISLPGRSGLDILKQVKSMKPTLPVLVLSIYPEDQYAIRALKSGASGYLTKGRAPEELKEAVRKISKGHKYITSSLAEKLADRLSGGMGELPHETLSDREYQVMCMIASGKMVSRIAEELSLSVKTISTHRSRLLKKMALKNNAELTRYAIEHNLLD